MRTTLRIIILAACCLPLLRQDAFACECKPSTPGEARKHAEVVFAGTVLESYKELTTGGFEWRVKLSVEQSWKGDVGDEVVIYVPGDDCAVQFEKGAKYLVYARRQEGRGRLTTSTCIRTGLLEQGGEDLQKLGKPRPNGGKGS